jgi:hypothetical protein
VCRKNNVIDRAFFHALGYKMSHSMVSLHNTAWSHTQLNC